VTPIEQLSIALGTSLTAGINLYATVAALGLAQAAGLIVLPPGLQVLGDPLVITLALVLYVVEFVADKVPYVDSAWDALHTFIRVPAGAVLAARAIGPVDPALELVAGLAGGGIAFAAHGTKATTRLVINASPEPFTNWAASIAEDVAAIGALWVAFHHPWLMMALVFGFLGLFIYVAPKVMRGIAALFRRVTGRRPPMAQPTLGAS
jgi:hypothetical protein